MPGLRNVRKHKALFLFVKQLKTDFCFFQESHSVSSDLGFWRAQWGNDLWFSHWTEKSAAVVFLKNRFPGDIVHTDTDPKRTLYLSGCEGEQGCVYPL